MDRIGRPGVYCWWNRLAITLGHFLLGTALLMMILDRLASWLRGRPPTGPATPVAIVDGVPLSDESPAVRHVAERLRQRDLAAGGWAAEAGGLTLESYLPEARRLVQRITLGGGDGGPPAP